MPDCTSALLKLYIPEGGLPTATATAIVEGLRRAIPFIDAIKDAPGYRPVLAKGGTIHLEDHDAPWGWPFGISLDEPDTAPLQVPRGIDYDYHTDSKYDITSIWRFRRGTRAWGQPSNQGKGLHLDRANLEELQTAGLALEGAIQMTSQVPPPTYPVPEQSFHLTCH